MPGERRPNILVVLFDALGADTLEQYRTQLPALTALRGASLVFNNAYTPGSQSGPARASLFTGLDPSVHGVWTDGVALADHEQTFPRRLSAAGYSTWLVGRRQLSGLSHWTTEPLRADEYSHCELAHGPLHRSRQNAYLNWLQSEAPDVYTSIFPLQPDPDNTKVPEAQRDAINNLADELSFNHWVGRCATRLIASHTDDRPFLGVAGFVVGSALGSEPCVHGEGLNVNAAVQADSALGRIIDCLHKSGRADNTLVVACAAHGNPADNAAAHPLSENRIRVPLSVSVPAVDAAVETQLVSTIDIAATICNIAQLQAPQRLQGTSLLSTAADNHRLSNWMLSRQRCDRGGWYTALRFEYWKLVVLHGRGLDTQPVYQLFDLATDPLEQTDLAAVAGYEARLEEMIDVMIDARCALEDRTEPRIAKF